MSIRKWLNKNYVKHNKKIDYSSAKLSLKDPELKNLISNFVLIL